MKTKNKTEVLLLLVLGYLVLTGISIAKGNAAYEISKYTINSGGGKMAGGSFEIKSSIGQADASQTLSNGNYSLTGGFWHENNDLIYKNGFE